MRTTDFPASWLLAAGSLVVAVGGCAQTVQVSPGPSFTSPVVTVVETPPEEFPVPSSQQQIDPVLLALQESALAPILDAGLAQSAFGGSEIESFKGLADIRDRSSAVVVARVLGAGPERIISGDAQADTLKMTSIRIEVIEFLAGTRKVEVGEVLVMEPMYPIPESVFGSVWIFFLRSKEDDVFGRPYPGALPAEEGIWRDVNSQGKFVDAGLGRPVNPMTLAAAWDASGRPGSLLDFAAAYDPSTSKDPVEVDVSSMTTAELLEFLRAG